jgi:DNA-binding response OmpR family regulator
MLGSSDGLDVCRHLKNDPTTMNIPVLMISALPDIGKLSKLAGADGYIEKPFDTGTLLEKIRFHIAASREKIANTAS